MHSIYSFIVSPKKKRYNNEITIGDKTLITNSNVEDHNLVSKQAVIISVPLMYKGDIKIGDEVMIHHNILEDGMIKEAIKEIVLNILKRIYIFAT